MEIQTLLSLLENSEELDKMNKDNLKLKSQNLIIQEYGIVSKDQV